MTEIINEQQKQLNETMRRCAVAMDKIRNFAKKQRPEDWEAFLFDNCAYQRLRADYSEARVQYNNNLFRIQRQKVNEDFDRLWAEFQHFTVDHKRYQLATKELEAEISRLKYQRGKVFG